MPLAVSIPASSNKSAERPNLWKLHESAPVRHINYLKAEIGLKLMKESLKSLNPGASRRIVPNEIEAMTAEDPEAKIRGWAVDRKEFENPNIKHLLELSKGGVLSTVIPQERPL